MNDEDNIFTARKANIYLRNDLAGCLEKLSTTKYQFTYAQEWLSDKNFPIGLSLPLNKNPFIADELFPFFDNLIPEGWLLSSVSATFKIDRKNRYALLLATGQETIGAVKVIAVNEKGKELRINIPKNIFDKSKYSSNEIHFTTGHAYCSYCLNDLTESQIKKNRTSHEKCAKEMWGTTRKIKLVLNSVEPLQSFRDTVRGASVSGAQKKGLFSLEKNELIPTSFGSTYILKPQGDYPHLPENEHLTMAIAKAIGLNVPPFAILKHKTLGQIFAIKRFDVVKDRVHVRVEDFAQVLGYASEEKYDSSYEELAVAIEKYSDAPRPDVVEMWKRLIFCFLTGNGDMHLKNWSFLEQDTRSGVFRLSPCYDFLNTRLAIGDDEDCDIGLDLSDGKRKLTLNVFLKFAENLKITPFALKILKDLDSWRDTAGKLCARSFLPAKMKARFLSIVNKRYDILRNS
jgi:serine/threonine-protein kinase HipA